MLSSLNTVAKVELASELALVEVVVVRPVPDSEAVAALWVWLAPLVSAPSISFNAELRSDSPWLRVDDELESEDCSEVR